MTTFDERVRECAHQIWIAEGKPEGQAYRHWETACRLTEMWAGGTFRPATSVPSKETTTGEMETQFVHAVESEPSPAPAISLIDTGPIGIPLEAKKAAKPSKPKKAKATEDGPA
ncbi:MAG TPA: DUF2934 domain-containing protein [Cellvibrionaceae bacterium]